MRKIFLFAFAVLTTHWNYAQFVVFNDNTVGTNQNQNIRTAANTGAPIQDLVPIGGRVVAISQVTGGTHSGGNQWYLIDYPNNSGASTQGYMAAGIPLSLPECNRSYFTVTNSNGSSNIRTDHTLSAANVQLSGTSLVGWTGQKFALVSTNYIDQDNYRWYNIYLTVNCSPTTGWIAGYSIGSGATLGTVSSSNYNGVLNAPTLSSATNVGNNGADISWATSNIDYYFKRYEIYLNTTMAYSQSQLNYDGLSNSINKTLSGLSSNTAYSCYVIAYNASGCNSAQSNTINFTTTGGCPSQSAPTASSATSTQQTSFQANWSAASGASGYRIDVSTNSSFSSFVSGYNNLDVSNVLLKSVTGLACNTTYYYRVWAYNNCGNTSASPSSTITVTTTTCPCGSQSAPTASSATSIQQTSFQANWSAASGASGYRIDVSTNSSFSSFVSGYNNLDVSNVLLKSVIGLACNTTYYYRVWAYNSCGNISASPSSTITIVTATCPSNPSLAVPQVIVSPLGTPSGISEGCYCINQSHFVVTPHTCQSAPVEAVYGLQFWQRGDCAGSPVHGVCGTGIPGQCNSQADDSYAWDCNMNLPEYDLDREQNVYAVEDGYIMTGDDFAGWGPSSGCPSCGQSVGQLLIKHDNGGQTWYSGYLHMEQITSKKFASSLAARHVYAGEIIGVVGQTGANNYHLHFATYYRDPSISTKLRSVDRTIQTRLVPSSEFRLAVVGSIVSGAKIFIKKGGVWTDNRVTDENGNTQILFMPAVQQGDSLRIVASGYEPITLGFDSNIIVNKKIVVPLLEELSSPSTTVKYPKVIALEQKTFYSTPNVSLKVCGENFLSYDVVRVTDLGDSTSYNTVISNNTLQDSIISVSLIDTGSNTFLFLFKGIDTLNIFKSFVYAPDSTNSYSVTLNLPNQLLGSKLYCDGSFIKPLSSSVENILLSNGVHFLSIQSIGYIDTTITVNSTGNISIALQPISYSSNSDSVLINFTTSSNICYVDNVTVMDSSSQSVISVTHYNDSFSGLALIPQSRKFEIKHINSNWSNIRFVAALDQIEKLSKESIYLMRIYDDVGFTKIPFDTVSIASYDSIVQKLSYNYINFNDGIATKESLVIMKKQAPITHNISTQYMFENDSLIVPLSQIFSDPDSIPNDMTFTIINDHPMGLHLNFSGSNVNIYSMIGYVGSTTVIISAQHDFITVYDTININIVSRTGIKEIKSISDVQLYPNPSNGDFILSFNTSKSENVQIKIFNLQGQQLMEEKPVKVNGLYKREIKLSGILPKGVYLLALKVGQQSITKQIVFE